MIVIRAIVLACISLIFTGAAQAQFPGDVFFQNPSIAIQEGGTGQIEVVTFAGTDVLGAAQFDIVFDPSALEVVGVTPGSAEELERTMVSKVSNGKVSVIILNDRSLTKPFGTVSLARIDGGVARLVENWRTGETPDCKTFRKAVCSRRKELTP